MGRPLEGFRNYLSGISQYVSYYDINSASHDVMTHVIALVDGQSSQGTFEPDPNIVVFSLLASVRFI